MTRIDTNSLKTFYKVVSLIDTSNFPSLLDIASGNFLFLNLLSAGKSDRRSCLSLYGTTYQDLPTLFQSSPRDLPYTILYSLDLNRVDWPIKVPIKSFDYITVLDVIEHLPNPSLFFSQVCQLLKPETGRLIVSVPNIYSYRSRIRFLLTGNLSAFHSSSTPGNQQNFDYHIWPPLIHVLDFHLRCNNMSIVKLHYAYGKTLLFAHTLVFEIKLNSPSCFSW